VRTVQTNVVVLVPGMGDDIQAIKAGIMEIGDIFVVNKADREGADATVRDIRHMISLGDRTEPNLWRPPVPKTVAAKGEGIDEVMTSIDDHFAWMEASGALRDRRVRRAGDEIEAIAIQALRSRIGDLRHGQGVDELAGDVVDGTSDPYAAADRILAAVT